MWRSTPKLRWKYKQHLNWKCSFFVIFKKQNEQEQTKMMPYNKNHKQVWRKRWVMNIMKKNLDVVQHCNEITFQFGYQAPVMALISGWIVQIKHLCLLRSILAGIFHNSEVVQHFISSITHGTNKEEFIPAISKRVYTTSITKKIKERKIAIQGKYWFS